MSKRQTQTQDRGKGTTLTRRQMMKASGWTLGAATVGVGSQQLGTSPIQESEAIAPLAAAGLVGTGMIAGAAGIIAVDKLTGENHNIDESMVAKNYVHDRASAITSQRAGYLRDTIKQNWVNKQNDQTPYADSAWSEFEAAAAKKIVNGESGDAEQAAFNANKRQMARAYHNALQGWNQAVIGAEGEDGILGPLRKSFEAGTGQPSLSNRDPDLSDTNSNEGDYNWRGLSIASDEFNNGWQPVSASEINDSGSYAVFKKQWQPSFVSLSSIDALPDKVWIYGLPYDISDHGTSGPTPIMVAPKGAHIDTSVYYEDSDVGEDWWGDIRLTGDINFSHPSRDTTTPLMGTLYSDYLSSIDSTYSDLQNNQISSYVTKLDNALAQGTIDPEDIISPTDAMREFDDSSEQTRYATEMVFSGIGSPSADFGYQAKVSHPDLTADSLWGDLYISFSGSPQTVNPGKTFTSSEYDLAYLGYNRKDNSEYTQVLLSGSSDLQILDIADIEGEDEFSDYGEQTAGSNGKVFVWPASRDGDPPETIQYPGEFDTYSVTVVGANTTSSHPVTKIKENSEGYYLPSTGLAEGELVESVRVVPSVEYSKGSDFIQDTSTVNSEDIESRLNQMDEYMTQIQEVEDAANSSVAGGFGSGLPSLPGFGVIESAVIVGGGLIGLNLLSN